MTNVRMETPARSGMSVSSRLTTYVFMAAGAP
jgi:hypothetical protein